MKPMFASFEEALHAPPEAIGVFIVKRMQVHGASYNISNTARDLPTSFRQPNFPDEWYRVWFEGVAWARNALLIIDDPKQSSGHGWITLTRKGELFNAEDLNIIRLQQYLPDFMLHPSIRAECLPIYNAGKFEAAVFEAFKRLEIRIRQDAGFGPHEYGTDMVSRAFNESTGPLTDQIRSSAERQSLQRLMSGAHGFLKNPRSHRDTDLSDPQEAAEMLVIASYLLRLLDGRSTPPG